MTSIRFALNHMAAPSLAIDDFFALARSLGIDAVEIRNDLSGNAILDGTQPETIRQAAARHGVTIISINALQRFNEWNATRAAEAQELIDYAGASGAKALVLVPKNDGTGCADGERQANLRQSLIALKPMLEEAGIIGLAEPLGFEICSLRSKTEAAEAIRELGAESTFRLVHDTFHHHLAGEAATFPELAGLVHIRGCRRPARQCRAGQGAAAGWLYRPVLLRALCGGGACAERPGRRAARQHGVSQRAGLKAARSLDATLYL
jgi:2-keto-myo-inositol isomerase